MKLTRIVVLACAIGMLVGCTSTSNNASAPSSTTKGTVRSADPAQAEAITKLVQSQMTERHLRSVIVRVTVDGKEITTQAFGESMTGVPATTDMHFRNGAVAISYVSTLLLMLVDEKVVSLDDKVSKWLPEIPHSDEVTLGQLAQMTSGYVDFVLGNEEVDRPPLHRPVPAVDTRGASRHGVVEAALLHPRHELELRPHQLPDPRPGAREDHGKARCRM